MYNNGLTNRINASLLANASDSLSLDLESTLYLDLKFRCLYWATFECL